MSSNFNTSFIWMFDFVDYWEYFIGNFKNRFCNKRLSLLLTFYTYRLAVENDSKLVGILYAFIFLLFEGISIEIF